jgi:hypothetical protein
MQNEISTPSLLPMQNDLRILGPQEFENASLDPAQALFEHKFSVLRHRDYAKGSNEDILRAHAIYRAHILPLQPHSSEVIHSQQSIDDRRRASRKSRLRRECMLQVGNGVALLQPCCQNMRCEVVVGAQFGTKNGFAMVPESVDAVEKPGFVSWVRGFGEKPVEEHGGNFALKRPELNHTDCSRPGGHLRSFGWLAFEHRRVAWLVMRGSGWWGRLLLRWMTAWSSRGGLCWYKGHAVCMGGLHSWCWCNGRIRCWRWLIRCGRRMGSIRSTGGMGSQRPPDMVIAGTASPT